MATLPRITEVEYLGDHRLRLTFNDRLVRDLDFAPVVERGGVFDSLRDPAFFARVGVDSITGTICWPNDLDLDPDVLHGDHQPASGVRPILIAEHRLRPTA